MHDQADKLRALVRDAVATEPTLRPGPAMIVCTGGERGVGVSTLCVQLADELTAIGKRVVLIDADLHAPALNTLLQASPEAGLAEVLSGQRTAAEALHKVGHNLTLLAATGRSEAAPLELSSDAVDGLLSQLNTLHTHADLLLIDAGGKHSPWCDKLCSVATQILLTTTPEPSAIVESYARLKALDESDAASKTRVVINRVTDQALARRLAERFVSTSSYFLELFDLPVSCVDELDRNSVGDAGRGFRDAVALLATRVLRSVTVHHRRASSTASQPIERKASEPKESLQPAAAE